MISAKASWARSRAASSPRCRDDERVQVAVAGVGDVGDQDVVAAADLVDPAEHLRDLDDRDADVLGEHRSEPLDGRVGEAAGGEQRVGLLLVAGHRAERRAGGVEARLHLLGERVALGAGVVDAGQEDHGGVGLEAEVLPVVDRLEAVPVEQLEGGRDDAGPGDGDDGVAGGDGGREEPDDGALGGAGRPQPDGDLGDDAEGALGADHQRRRGRSRRRPWPSAGRAGRSRRCR